MIPYTLSERYESKITTYPNEEFTYMESLLKSENLTLDYLENTQNETRDIRRYLRDNAKNIDILQVYHLRYKVLPFIILAYKTRNRRGKIFLKLDANNQFIDFLVKRSGLLPSLRRLYVKVLFKFINLVSIETKRNYDTLIESSIINKDKLLYLPNGVQETKSDITRKEHVISYVGFIEKRNKSTDMLINAFSNIDCKDWKLELTGSVDEDMEKFIDDFFETNPHMKDRIIFNGYVSDKEELSDIYAKSSIYCCTSIKESFGISTLEAAYHGNYIISTDVGGSSDIINKSRYGQLIEHDTAELEETLQYVIDNWENIKENPLNIQKEINDEFNWKNLCNKIIKKIEG